MLLSSAFFTLLLWLYMFEITVLCECKLKSLFIVLRLRSAETEQTFLCTSPLLPFYPISLYQPNFQFQIPLDSNITEGDKQRGK